MNEPPPFDAPPPAQRRGTPRAGATPLMENVRITAPDLARRAALERTRSRLLFACAGFALLFGAVAAKLADATILFPLQTRHVEQLPPLNFNPEIDANADPGVPAATARARRSPTATASCWRSACPPPRSTPIRRR